MQTIWSVIFTTFWLIWGSVLAFYCATNDSSITRTNHTGISSILEVKSINQTYYLSSTDQFVVVGTPYIIILAWFVALLLGWTRIHFLADLCYCFCQRGFRIDSNPEITVIVQFLINYFIYFIGQTIVNIYIALAYCPTLTKQVLFASELPHLYLVFTANL